MLYACILLETEPACSEALLMSPSDHSVEL